MLFKSKNLKKKSNFIPKKINIIGDLLKIEHKFKNYEIEIDKLYGSLPYYIGTIKLKFEYEYFGKIYYFVWTDVPNECINNLKKLCVKLDKNKIKPKSKLLSVEIWLNQKNTKIDFLNEIQKYEDPFSSFSNNSIKLTDINQLDKYYKQNKHVELHFINNKIQNITIADKNDIISYKLFCP